MRDVAHLAVTSPSSGVGSLQGLAVGVFVAGPVTGGAVNPARALGPMIVAGQFTAWWVYLVGGVIAAVIYDRFVRKADAP